MKLSESGYKLICKFEGVKTTAYQDSVNLWTVGIGFIVINGKPVKKGDTMTLDEVKTEFFKQITMYEDTVNKLVTKPINQNQFDALVSFTFNLGAGNFKSSTLLRKVNINPNDTTIEDEFKRWAMAGGKPVKGLLVRRIEEANYYFAYCF